MIAGTAALAAATALQLVELHHVEPEAAGFNPAGLERVASYLDREVSEGSFPGAILVVGRSDGIVFTHATGVYGVDDRRPVADSTIYDLASLTKVIGLTTAVMLLVEDGSLNLQARVQDYVPEFQGPGKSEVRVVHLLTHTSGLPPFRPLYSETSSAREALAEVYATDLTTPPGSSYAYSDLGAILLTQIAQRVAGERIDSLLRRQLFQPLGMQDTGYLPAADLRHRIAPTEDDPWRGYVVRGEVHDENAHRLGGVSGHAGLFSTAPDLARFAIWVLAAYHGRLPENYSPHLSVGVVREFTRRQNLPPGSTRALGWDTPSENGSSAGSLFSRVSFGHTGFTGTSIWIDPERELFVILLTNRVHPSRENTAIRSVRGRVADLVVSSLGSQDS